MYLEVCDGQGKLLQIHVSPSSLVKVTVAILTVTGPFETHVSCEFSSLCAVELPGVGLHVGSEVALNAGTSGQLQLPKRGYKSRGATSKSAGPTFPN